MLDINMTIEELGLSGSVGFPGISVSTLRRYAKLLNESLESQHFDWHVKAYPKEDAIAVTQKGWLNRYEKKEFAEKLIDYFDANGFSHDTFIYDDTYRYSTDEPHNHDDCENCITSRRGTPYYRVRYDGNPCKYYNPNSLTVTTEGALYSVLAFGTGKEERKINEIAEQYGMYMERGEAWNFSFYAYTIKAGQ